MEWISLFDDMGIFYLCEPMGAIRRMLRKFKIGRVDRDRGGGSCLGSKSRWERDTMSWVSSMSSMASEIRENRGNGRRRHHVSGGRSRGSEGQGSKGMAEGEEKVESVSGIGSVNGNGNERVSGASRRRSERAASSVAASNLGQSLKGGLKGKAV